MKAKNVLYRVFCSSFMAAGSMYAFNKFHSIYALKNHILTSSPENYFKWNGERIYYNCIGKGEPVLLLHALHPAASAEEWQLITESLSKDHKVFVLDLEEVQKYCPTDEDRKIGKWWWLRNPGSGLLSVACVYEDGTLYDYGINNNYTDGGVRPAMWVRIKQ